MSKKIKEQLEFQIPSLIYESINLLTSTPHIQSLILAIKNYNPLFLYYFINVITHSPKTNHLGYKILSSKILQYTFGNQYHKYINILIECGIIECNNYYNNIGNKKVSLGYRINWELYNISTKINFISFLITIPKPNYKLLKRKRADYSEFDFDRNISDDKYNIYIEQMIKNSKGITINETLAINELLRLYNLKEIQFGTYATNLQYINEINSNNLHFSIGENNKRLSCLFTFIKRELRQFVNFNGNYFNEKDIKASQPTLFNHLTKHITSEFHSIIEHSDIYDELNKAIIEEYKDIKEPNGSDKIIVIREFDDNGYQTKKQEYKYNEIPRSVIKELTFRFLFSNCRSNSIVSYIFKKRFKEIYDYVKYKFKHNLAETLQLFESTIFYTFSQLLLKHKIVFFTVFDSIYFLTKDTYLVNQLFQQTLNEFNITICKTTFKPKFIPNSLNLIDILRSKFIKYDNSKPDLNINDFNPINKKYQFNVILTSVDNFEYNLYNSHLTFDYNDLTISKSILNNNFNISNFDLILYLILFCNFQIFSQKVINDSICFFINITSNHTLSCIIQKHDFG
jgi:hypothetical protein